MSAIDHEIVILDNAVPSVQNNDDVTKEGGTINKFGTSWQEFLSESGCSMNDKTEEGFLIDLEDETKSSDLQLPSNQKTGWRDFASDPGINLSDDNVSLPQRHSWDYGQTRNDWSQFDRGKLTHSLPFFTEKDKVVPNQTEHAQKKQWATPDMVGNFPTSHDAPVNQPHPVTMTTVSSDIVGTLPIRPLTIGDNETMTSTLVYRPLSPFNPDLYPSRSTFPTPAVTSQPQTSQGIPRIPDTDDVRDMSARERLQPLGRDGLEVKQGPPWGMSMPVFQPHSRDSSMSSDDSESYARMQIMPQTPKVDDDPLVASLATSDGQLSRRSSIRSLESKEPVAAAKIISSDNSSVSKAMNLIKLTDAQEFMTTAKFTNTTSTITTSARPLEPQAQAITTNGNGTMYPPRSTQLQETVATGGNEMVTTTTTTTSWVKLLESKEPTGVAKFTNGVTDTWTPNTVFSSKLSGFTHPTAGDGSDACEAFRPPAPKDSMVVRKVNDGTENGKPTTMLLTRSTESKEPAVLDNRQSGPSKTSDFVRTAEPELLSGPENGSENESPKAMLIPKSTKPLSMNGAELDPPKTAPSLTSLEPKEPLSARQLVDNGFIWKSKTPMGRFHDIHQKKADTESPVSRILGPTFKTTQKILQDLQRRPLSMYQGPLNDVASKMPEKDNNIHEARDRVEEKRLTDHERISNNVYEGTQIEHDILGNNFPPVGYSDMQRSGSLTPSYSSTPEHKWDEKVTSLNDFSPVEDLVPYKVDKATDNTLSGGDPIPQKDNSVSSFKEDYKALKQEVHIEGDSPESLSWDNILDVPSDDGGGNAVSEFDRVASQSISMSNAVANSFREEFYKTNDLLEIDSAEEEGVLTDDMNEHDLVPDSGLSETTTNEELPLLPKGLTPLNNQGPAGIYDVRKSSSPGSTNRKRLAIGRSAVKPDTRGAALYTPVYVSESTNELSSTEVEEKALGSLPDGQSTPKTDEDMADASQDKAYSIKNGSLVMNGVRIPSKYPTSDMVSLSPTTVDYTWSVKSPVMSQLSSKAKPLILSKERKIDHKTKVDSVKKAGHVKKLNHERKRVSRPKNQDVIKTRHDKSSESHSSHYDGPHDRIHGEVKKSVADIILENFRREEKEQKKRQKKMEELKQMGSSADLNALWDRFQQVFGKKNTHKRKLIKHSITPPFLRTPPSEVSSAADADVSESTLSRTQSRVNSSIDSNKEFDHFLQRIREVDSSFSEGADSRRFSRERRRRVPESTPSTNKKSSRDSSSTSEKSSEFETPLAIPVLVSKRSKLFKKPLEDPSVRKGHAMCTCGARAEKANTKVPGVRDVGVNCPTPPAIVLNSAPSPLTNRDMNVLNTARVPVEDTVQLIHNIPASLVKLSLQDAFLYSNQDFIKRSRERVSNIRKKQPGKSKDIIVVPTERTELKIDREQQGQEELQTVVAKPLRIYDQLAQKKPRPMTQKEIRNVNKRMCKKLPEVKRRKEEERRAAYYQTNRLRAQLYGKHVRNLNRMYTGH